jgi:hypothetical protein
MRGRLAATPAEKGQFLHLARVYPCKMQGHLASPFFSPSINLQEPGVLRLAGFWAFFGCFLHALQVFLATCFSSESHGHAHE